MAQAQGDHNNADSNSRSNRDAYRHGNRTQDANASTRPNQVTVSDLQRRGR